LQKVSLLNEPFELVIFAFHGGSPDLPNELVKDVSHQDASKGWEAPFVIDLLDERPETNACRSR
jgi:hypothetical protein